MYTTPDTIKRFSGLIWKPEVNPIINEMILASQEYIENYCGDENFGKRRFDLPEEEVTENRVFDGNGNTRLYFGDALRLSQVQIDGETIDLSLIHISEPTRPY